MNERELREKIRDKYGALARGEDRQHECACGCGESACCAPDSLDRVSEKIGYRGEEMESIPAGANLGLGCGNPIDLAEPKEGETVLDLGSGAGIDCFLAARMLGPGGRAIGIDMTPNMIEKARANAKKGGYTNVEFRLGEIEALPIDDESVDIVISNCVINMSHDKPRVFREAFRVLRPGGRLAVSDLVLRQRLPEAIRESVDAFVGCVAGASLLDDYLRDVRDAGFVDVEVLRATPYTVNADALEPDSAERNALSAVVSAQIRARRP